MYLDLLTFTTHELWAYIIVVVFIPGKCAHFEGGGEANFEPDKEETNMTIILNL